MKRKQSFHIVFFLLIFSLLLSYVGCKPKPPTEIIEGVTIIQEPSNTHPPEPTVSTPTEPIVSTPTKTLETATAEPSETATAEPSETATTEPTEPDTEESTETSPSEVKERFRDDGVYIVKPTTTISLLELSFSDMNEVGIGNYFSEAGCYFPTQDGKVVFGNNFHIFFDDSSKPRKKCLDIIDEREKNLCNDLSCFFELYKFEQDFFDMKDSEGKPFFIIKDIQRIIVYAEIDPLIVKKDNVDVFSDSHMVFSLNCAGSDAKSDLAEFHIGSPKKRHYFFTSHDEENTYFPKGLDNSDYKMAYVLIIDLSPHDRTNNDGDVILDDEGKPLQGNWVYIYEYRLSSYAVDNSIDQDINSLDVPTEQGLNSFDILETVINKISTGDYSPSGGTLLRNDYLNCSLDSNNPGFIIGSKAEGDLGTNVWFKYLIFETRESVENNYFFYEYPTNNLN